MSESISIKDELLRILSNIKDQKAKIQSRLNKAPAGSLYISKKWNRWQYYHRFTPNKRHGTYIQRKDQDLAVRLAQKDYDAKLLAELEKQLKAIERFLKDFNQDAMQLVYEKQTEPRKALINKGFLTDEEFVRQWLDEPYRKLSFREDEPEYYTSKDERVRSKSEILIADALSRHGIPYKYECPVYINGVPVAAPDFKCLNVRQRQEYYWEHLGMMGDRNYINKNVKKLETYTLAKEFDESKLILTFESENHPLNTRVIEEKISRYLL